MTLTSATLLDQTKRLVKRLPRLTAISLVLLAVFSGYPTLFPEAQASPENIDQKNDVPRAAVANQQDFGQSFTPTKSKLAKIDLALDSVGNVNTYTVTVNIRESWGGPVIGSASTDVPPDIRNADVGEFVQFVFAAPLELTPGTQYIMQVDLGLYYHQGGTNDMISWYVAGGDTYAGGQRIQEGISGPDDMIFRAWTSTTPLPWTQVNTDGFGDPGKVRAFDWTEFGAYVYVGVGADGSAKVLRSSDGTAWGEVGGDVFGDPNNKIGVAGFPIFEEFQSELYVSVVREPA